MSKPVKILAIVVAVALLVSVVLTMLGKPPNLPLGPLKGALAGEEEPVDTTSTTPTPAVTNPCPPGQILAGSGAAGATDPTGAGAGATGAGATAADPTGAGAAAGAGAGAGAGATGAGATGTPGAATGTGTPTGAIITGVSYSGDAPRMLRVADVTGTPSAADPTGAGAAAAAAGAAGAGATGTGTTGAGTPAVGATGAAASAGSADPAATGQTSCIPDPSLGAAGAGAGTGATDPTGAGAGAGTGAGAGAGAGTGATGTGTPAAPTNQRMASDGANSGNSPEALRIAGEIASVMKTVNLNVSTSATLFPGAGGAAPVAQRKVYRTRVTTAVVVVKLTDATTVQQWGSAGKPTQMTLVKSFIQRLGKNYPKASRSVTVTDSTGNVLAIGDAAPGGGAKAGKVIVY